MVYVLEQSVGDVNDSHGASRGGKKHVDGLEKTNNTKGTEKKKEKKGPNTPPNPDNSWGSNKAKNPMTHTLWEGATRSSRGRRTSLR